MTAIKLDGEALAARTKKGLAGRIEALIDRGITPGLGTLIVGDDPASHKYVSMKHHEYGPFGVASFDVRLPGDASEVEVRAVVDRFNADPAVDAFILQYPFPDHLDYGAILLAADPAKDADGLHPVNLGRLVMGEAAPLPCTPAGIQAMLVDAGIEIAGSHVVVVGRGLTIGRPLANLLSLKQTGANAAVTVVHTGVPDIGHFTRQADILVAAAGTPDLITADMVKPGAAVIAAGVSFPDGKLRSDVAADVAEVAGWLSPKTGGVGPMTRAMLLANTVAAAEHHSAS